VWGPETALAQGPANVVHRLKNRNLLSRLSTTRTLVGTRNGVDLSRVNNRRMETAEHFFAPPLVDQQAPPETQRALVEALCVSTQAVARQADLFKENTCQIPDDATLQLALIKSWCCASGLCACKVVPLQLRSSLGKSWGPTQVDKRRDRAQSSCTNQSLDSHNAVQQAELPVRAVHGQLDTHTPCTSW
jgi:hypothetical protein